MMPLLRLRGSVRLAVTIAAFVGVAAVSYEAGAHGVGTQAWHSERTAHKETRSNGPPAMNEIAWTVTTRSDSNPTSFVWREMDAQGELMAAQAAMFLGADGIAAHHLLLAAGALRGNDQANVQQAAKELEDAADALKKGKASDDRVQEVMHDAFEASSNLGEGEE